MTTTVSFTVDSAHGPRPVSVNYERTGAGAPLVLLHGIGHHHQAWDPVTRILAAEREVIALDLPGFGSSPALPDGVPYTLEAVTPVLGAFFAALGLDRPHVAGNSLGGLFALELGRRELVRSVTALSPAGFWNEPERRYAFTTLRAMRRAALALPAPAIERLSRSAAGRTALTSTIYARPGRRSPEAVVAETLALRGATGFHQTLAAGGARLLHRRCEGPSRHRRLGHPRPHPAAPAGYPRQAGDPRGQARAAARLRARPDERRPRPGGARHPRHQPLRAPGACRRDRRAAGLPSRAPPRRRPAGSPRPAPCRTSRLRRAVRSALRRPG